MKIHNVWKFVIAVGVSQAAGAIGSFFTFSAIPEWYAFLEKPSFAPPNWLFGPVWTALYLMMGIAAFLAWRAYAEESDEKRKKAARTALAIFGVQLALNALWSIIFFGMRAPGAAFVEIVALWIAIAASIVAFEKVSRTAAWLMVPYLAWVSFAAALNFGIYALNR